MQVKTGWVHSITSNSIAPNITIEQMKAELRATDCLYDNAKFLSQLGAKIVPAIPDTVIEEA